MPSSTEVEIIDRLSALEANMANMSRRLEDMSGDLKTLTAAYNQAVGAKWSLMAVAGVVGFVASYGSKLVLAALGMIK